MNRPLHSEPAPRERGWWLRSYVLDREEFNEMRLRLPQAVRRKVEPVPEGHVGLVAQAVAGDSSGIPLAVLYDSAPPPVSDARMRALARQLVDLLG